MITIKGLGGFQEVGRSAILIDTGVEKFLLDYGVSVQTMQTPIEPSLNLDAIFLSHPHLDHSGNIPSLYKRGYEGSVFATPTTFDLCSILLRDSMKVQKRRGLKPSFLIHDIKMMEHLAEYVFFKQKIEFGASTIEFRDAGHVPGSASILLESQNKRILYTGDIKFIDTELMKGADTDYKDIDVLICEATYSYKQHPDRKVLTAELKEKIQNIVHNNGIVLLPSFAIGRTQEMLSIVSDLNIPIYMDGMGIRATESILRYPKYVRDPDKLKKAFGKAHKIKKDVERKTAIEKPCIVIASAGMLQGGPITYYIKKLYNREDCALILNGFMVPKTVGRTLLDTGRYINEGIDVKPKMKVEFMDFSAHTDHNHLINFFNKINPEKIILVHTDHGPEFQKELISKGFDALAPKNGESINV